MPDSFIVLEGDPANRVIFPIVVSVPCDYEGYLGVWVAYTRLRVESGYVVFTHDVSADSTNHADIEIWNLASTKNYEVAVAHIDQNFSAGQKIDMVINDSPSNIFDKDDQILIKITQAGSGIFLPPFTVQVKLEPTETPSEP